MLSGLSVMSAPTFVDPINKLLALKSLKLASFALMSPVRALIYKFSPIIFARNFPLV